MCHGHDCESAGKTWRLGSARGLLWEFYYNWYQILYKYLYHITNQQLIFTLPVSFLPRMDLTEMDCEEVNWIELAQYRA